jgi:hypothetical protein
MSQLFYIKVNHCRLWVLGVENLSQFESNTGIRSGYNVDFFGVSTKFIGRGTRRPAIPWSVGMSFSVKRGLGRYICGMRLKTEDVLVAMKLSRYDSILLITQYPNIFLAT